MLRSSDQGYVIVEIPSKESAETFDSPEQCIDSAERQDVEPQDVAISNFLAAAVLITAIVILVAVYIDVIFWFV